MVRDTDKAHEEHKEEAREQDLRNFVGSFKNRDESQDENPDDIWSVIHHCDEGEMEYDPHFFYPAGSDIP
jgi:hypothetical protein